MRIFYVATAMLLAACSTRTDQVNADRSEQPYFKERFRPQFHFTPEANWMNDPNGMVYYQGEYHLFYQYYPDSTVWGPMHWGHAVSADLVSWEHLPVGLYPDELGYIFSGSAVVDWNNSSGFGTSENPPLVAIFTHHLIEGERAGRTDYQYQSIAYSLDKGRSWTKYEGNPVLPNQGIKDFRDPKVFWHEKTEKWVMTLAVFDHVEFYGSPDLKSWEKLSEFGFGQGAADVLWECPDLFTLTADDGKKRWILIVSTNPGGVNGGSSTEYFIGDFDGTNFTNDNSPETVLWLDYGTDNYAGVTWSDIPEEDGRRLFMGWMSNWLYAQIVPTEKWRSAMTVSRELTLKQVSDGYRLASNPVSELKSIRGASVEIEGQTIDRELNISDLTFSAMQSEIELSFKNNGSKAFGVKLSNGGGETVVGFEPSADQFFIDRSNAGLSDFHQDFARRQVAPRHSPDETIRMRLYIDQSSVELFADDGLTVMTVLVFPAEDYDQLILFSAEGSAELISGTIYELNSIWNSGF